MYIVVLYRPDDINESRSSVCKNKKEANNYITHCKYEPYPYLKHTDASIISLIDFNPHNGNIAIIQEWGYEHNKWNPLNK